MTNLSLEQLDAIRLEGFRPQAVGCIINEDKKLFLVYKEEYKLWQLPQGGIENRESIKAGLMREMAEELGKDFVGRCAAPKEFVVSTDRVVFPPVKKKSRDLVTDEGKEVLMRGKHYFFCLLQLKGAAHFKIEDTGLDNYVWASYKQAKRLAEQIYQRGKRRITLGVLEVLKGQDLIG